MFYTDLEWKIIYVGSAENSDYDQVLDSVLVGPVPGGRHMFVFQVKCSSANQNKFQFTTDKYSVIRTRQVCEMMVPGNGYVKCIVILHFPSWALRKDNMLVDVDGGSGG